MLSSSCVAHITSLPRRLHLQTHCMHPGRSKDRRHFTGTAGGDDAQAYCVAGNAAVSVTYEAEMRKVWAGERDRTA